jgi:hypothetical protein
VKFVIRMRHILTLAYICMCIYIYMHAFSHNSVCDGNKDIIIIIIIIIIILIIIIIT